MKRIFLIWALMPLALSLLPAIGRADEEKAGEEKAADEEKSEEKEEKAEAAPGVFYNYSAGAATDKKDEKPAKEEEKKDKKEKADDSKLSPAERLGFQQAQVASEMGELEPWDLCLHPVLRNSSRDGNTYQQS